jgi:hypothetical protein
MLRFPKHRGSNGRTSAKLQLSWHLLGSTNRLLKAMLWTSCINLSAGSCFAPSISANANDCEPLPDLDASVILESGKTFLPAAGRDWLLPLHDLLVKLLGGDTARRIQGAISQECCSVTTSIVRDAMLADDAIIVTPPHSFTMLIMGVGCRGR